MSEKNLLVISNNFPNQDNSYVAEIFVKEQIKYLKDYFDNVYIVSPLAYGMERLRKTRHEDYQYENVKVFFPRYFNLPFCYFYGRTLWTFFATRAIRDLIEKEKLSFNLIHAHFTWPSGAVAVNLKVFYGSPVIITEHTSESISQAISSHDPSWIGTWKKADAIIRVKKSDISLIENTGIPKSKITHIPNGYSSKFIPMEMSKCRDLLGLPQDLKILVNVGNLYSIVKGHKYLIEAMRIIAEKRTDIRGIIIGSGNLEPSIRALVEELELNEYVHLVGSKPHSEIPLWMNACDIFVLPSLRESFGVVQIEALACGKPVVATRNGGSEEIITSDQYGLLAEPADPEDLSEKILLALDHEWDREKILAYAEQFTWKKIAKEIMDVYRSVRSNN